ncbi:MAG: hypothetical protein AAGA91_10640 [Pseudomonadota bacterium]
MKRRPGPARSFSEDVYRRARALRDKGMGDPLTWEDIAKHLWEYFLDYPEDWPLAESKNVRQDEFYEVVRQSVEDSDAGGGKYRY